MCLLLKKTQKVQQNMLFWAIVKKAKGMNVLNANWKFPVQGAWCQQSLLAVRIIKFIHCESFPY